MCTVRATIENSGESWLKWASRWIGVRDFEVKKVNGYKKYYWDEVIKHDKPHDCWIVVHNKIYDVTQWVPRHPGGKIIYDGAGGDCSSAWESYHPLSVIAHGIPKSFLVGEIMDYQESYVYSGKFYHEIKQRVEAALPGRKRKDDSRLALCGLVLMLGYFCSLFLYIYFCTWWAAVIYGLLCSQIGVNIMHDGNHGAFTSSQTLSWVAGYTLDMMGSSSVVYRRSHNFGHHSCVNHYELDRAFDTLFPFLRLHKLQEHWWFHRYQHLYAWFIYMASNFGDLFGTFDEFFWMSNFPPRRAYTSFSAFVFQVVVKLCWVCYTIIIPSWIHGFTSVFPLWLLYMFVFGIGYALFFAVNHWTPDAGFIDNSNVTSMDWAMAQVENSANFALGSQFWTWVTGGLNYQIEHHLFPNVAHTRLPEISQIVQEICREYNVTYLAYKSFWEAISRHYQLLKRLSHADELKE